MSGRSATADQLSLDVIASMRRRRFTASSESDLQSAIEQVLSKDGFVFEREVVLGPRDRIDFLTVDGIGVEVKIDHSLAGLTRQLFRYAEHERIAALVLVTTKNRLARLPDQILGKPVRALVLGSLA